MKFEPTPTFVNQNPISLQNREEWIWRHKRLQATPKDKETKIYVVAGIFVASIPSVIFFLMLNYSKILEWLCPENLFRGCYGKVFAPLREESLVQAKSLQNVEIVECH